jgi:hypothetical protein
MQHLSDEFILWLKKTLSWVIPSLFGFATELAYESSKKPVNWKMALSSAIMACFVGWLADGFLTAKGVIDSRGYIVAACALVSRNLIGYFLKNYRSFFKNALTTLADKLHEMVKKKP